MNKKLPMFSIGRKNDRFLNKTFLSLFAILFFAISVVSFRGATRGADRPEKTYLDDNKRYLAIMLVNDNETSDFRPIIQAAHNVGFNALYLSIRWDVVNCFNGDCLIGNEPNPNYTTRHWEQIDQQVEKAKQLGMKIAFRIHMGSADLRGFSPAPRSRYLWGDDNYMRKTNGSEDLGGYNFRQFSYSDQGAVDQAKAFIGDVLNRYGYLENEGNLLFISTSAGPAQEMEYSHQYLLDYSNDAKNAYTSWYQNNYGTTNPNVPEEFTSTEGRKWYKFRHQELKDFIDQVSTQINAYNSNIKFILDFGSAFDGASAMRGTFGFKSLSANTDGVKVNDAEFYDHRFSMDILRATLPNKWIMNEYLTYSEYVNTNVYSDFLNQSFAHGAKLFSVISNEAHLSQMSGLYNQVVNDWINPSMSSVNTNGSVSYSVGEVLGGNFSQNHLANGSRNIYQEWLNIYNNNPSNAKPVNVYLDDSELDGGGCNAPAAPTLSASATTITSGESTVLSASGCSGGTITWSDGLGTGSSKSVSPTATKTYTATCSLNGCSSTAASITINVNPPVGGGGCIVNKVRFQFRQSGECCMDRLPGAKIQGSNNGSNWTDLYTFTSNGTGSWQEFTFSNTTAYNSVRFVASSIGWGELHELEFYNGATKLSGTAFGTDNYSSAFDGNTSTSWHAVSAPGPSNYAGLNLTGCTNEGCSAPTLSASPSTITLGNNSTISATGCSGTVTWSDGLGTGVSKSVSPGATKTYTANCSINGCVSSSSSVTVEVVPPGGSETCINLNDQCSGNSSEVRSYSLSASAAGSYPVKVKYRSHEGAGILKMKINGGSWQNFNVNQTGVNEYVQISAGNQTLNSGNNSFDFASGSSYICFRELCVEVAGCSNPPSAPSLTASPSSISSGSSSTLSAGGCSGGTINWSNSLGSGTSKTVSPTSTTTYTASCSIGGCTSSNGSVTVTVAPPGGGPFSQCLESESQSGTGSITGDPNASNGNTRGLENNNNHYVDYAVTGVPSAGTYNVTLTYFSSSAPTVGVSINGGSAATINLANSGSWNIVNTTQTFNVSLASGNNTIRISGVSGGSCRQDKICVANGSASVLGVDPAAVINKNFSVYPNPNKGMFETSFYLEQGKKATIVVTDFVGRQIYRQQITGKGLHRERINLNNKASGTLLLQLIKDNATEVKKINIVR